MVIYLRALFEKSAHTGNFSRISDYFQIIILDPKWLKIRWKINFGQL
jgi:hypothetical protein